MKALKITAEAAKFVGKEHTFDDVTKENRKAKMMKALNWYNYNFNFKDAHKIMADYLVSEGRKDEAKLFKKSTVQISNSLSFLARMSQVGLKLTTVEIQNIEAAIKTAIASAFKEAPEDAEAEINDTAKKPNIQERMKERVMEAGGDVEALMDEYIAADFPVKHKLSPINVLKLANVLPAHVNIEVLHFERIKAELLLVQSGTDADLTEGYSNFNKTQLRRLIKFVELIISDYNSYVTFKKATKAKPKRRVKTPEQLVYKLKYKRAHAELNLKSVNPEKLIGAKEVWVYNAQTRKLIHILADDHAGGALTVRNNTLQGFDVMKTVQKTVRKPKTQMKEFQSASVPNKRKLFEEIKTVVVKFNGRFNENFVILKVL